MFEHQWHDYIKGSGSDNNHKLRTYCLFKSNFMLEPYLQKNLLVKKRNNFSKLRISAHTLAVETGRYTSPKTPVDERKCPLCCTSRVEDEKHVILYCKFYTKFRTTLFKQLNDLNDNFTNISDSEKFLYIMNTGGTSEACLPILQYVNDALEARKAQLGTS